MTNSALISFVTASKLQKSKSLIKNRFTSTKNTNVYVLKKEMMANGSNLQVAQTFTFWKDGDVLLFLKLERKSNEII